MLYRMAFQVHIRFRQARAPQHALLTHARLVCVQLFRSLFSAVLCCAIACMQRVPRLLGPLRFWPAYAVRGFPGAASMVFYYQAIEMLPLSDAVRTNSAMLCLIWVRPCFVVLEPKVCLFSIIVLSLCWAGLCRCICYTVCCARAM